MRACPACLSVFASEPEFCVFDGQRLGPADALIDRVLGGYRFEKLVGIGGTGCVFRGVEMATNTPCAIKLLYGETATDRSVTERFRREADAIRSINHPNIVKMLNTGRSPAGLTYIVMEFVDGPTLKTIIEDEGPLAPRRAGRLAEQLVAGLAEAHRQGFVHRDLKPGNIIVTRDERGAEHVKILDFGIVASLQTRTENERLTRTGYIVGTPTYMAPEQVDPKAISPQTDVYALGVILYEVLAGAPPYSGSLEQILVAKMTQKPPPLAHAGELGTLILSLLESSPARRPANALRVSAELSRISLLSDDPPTQRSDAVDPDRSGNGRASGVRLIDRTAELDGDDRTRADGEWSDTSPEPELTNHDAERKPPAAGTKAKPEPPVPLKPGFAEAEQTEAIAAITDTPADHNFIREPLDISGDGPTEANPVVTNLPLMDMSVDPVDGPTVESAEPLVEDTVANLPLPESNPRVQWVEADSAPPGRPQRRRRPAALGARTQQRHPSRRRPVRQRGGRAPSERPRRAASRSVQRPRRAASRSSQRHQRAANEGRSPAVGARPAGDSATGRP